MGSICSHILLSSLIFTQGYAQQPEWAQCGGYDYDGPIGQDYSGPTECADGLECVVTNKWWSSCKQVTPASTWAAYVDDSDNAGAPPAGSDVAPAGAGPGRRREGAKVQAFNQCGGGQYGAHQDYVGPTECVAGYECVEKEWWSLCLPSDAENILGSSVAPTADSAVAPCGAGPGRRREGENAQVPRWGTCGGQFYDGPTECAPGLVCVVKSKWYSQCLAPAAAAGDAAVFGRRREGAEAPVRAYGQCGGEFYDGPTVCVDGYECVVTGGKWFSMCKPKKDSNDSDGDSNDSDDDWAPAGSADSLGGAGPGRRREVEKLSPATVQFVQPTALERRMQDMGLVF